MSPPQGQSPCWAPHRFVNVRELLKPTLLTMSDAIVPGANTRVNRKSTDSFDDERSAGRTALQPNYHPYFFATRCRTSRDALCDTWHH